MKQTVPKPIPGLMFLARRNAFGAGRCGADLGLAHNTEPKINADIEAVEAS
jgi:hypothetical protein